MNNTPTAQRPKFSVAIQTDGYKKLINNTLQDPARAQRFIASIQSAVAVNPALQECDAGTILAGALLGESLELSPSPQLGQFYLVPFLKNKGKPDEHSVAVFILGYKGYLQLAIRSGQYKKLNVMSIKKGELVCYDALNEEIEVKLIQDEIEREVAETAGYYAMFEHVNGFRKTLYWSKEKMLAHAGRYSAAFNAKEYTDLVEGRIEGLTLKMIQDNEYISNRDLYKRASKMSSFWYKDFDGMAAKTMLRQLISKWGIMSIQVRSGLERDDSVIHLNGTTDYIGGEDIKLLTGAVQNAVDDFETDEDTEESAKSQDAAEKNQGDQSGNISFDEL